MTKSAIAYAVAGPIARAYGAAVRPAAPLFARRFTPPHRLHLGSGLIHLEGWVNIDWAPIPYSVLLRKPGPDLHADLSRAIPFPDRSATHVYANNFLEHLDRRAAQRCLAESARVLRPGGRIRVVVPDVGAYLRAYAERDSGFFEHARDSSGYWPELRTPLEHVATIVHGAPENGWRHLWAYDLDTISLYLADAGFADVTKHDVNESSDDALRGIDGDLSGVLAVEATVG